MNSLERMANRSIDLAEYTAAIKETLNQLQVTFDIDQKISLIWNLAYVRLRDIEKWRSS